MLLALFYHHHNHVNQSGDWLATALDSIYLPVNVHLLLHRTPFNIWSRHSWYGMSLSPPIHLSFSCICPSCLIRCPSSWILLLTMAFHWLDFLLLFEEPHHWKLHQALKFVAFVCNTLFQRSCLLSSSAPKARTHSHINVHTYVFNRHFLTSRLLLLNIFLFLEYILCLLDLTLASSIPGDLAS